MVFTKVGSGYGIHYPVRHGQVENWVRIGYVYCEIFVFAKIYRIIWNAFGPIQYSNTFGLSPKIITSFSQSLYVHTAWYRGDFELISIAAFKPARESRKHS